MVLRDFDELIRKVKDSGSPRRVVVAAAADEHSLEAVLRAQKDGMVTPVLVGDKAKIAEALSKLGASVPEQDIYDAPEAEPAAAKAVSLVREGKGDFLMKGKLETAQMLKPVVNKESGLGTGRLMSHFAFFQSPRYPKLLAIVDGGMVPYPTLEQKKAIIESSVGVLKNLGYENPRVGVLAAIEKLNPKMPETIDADALYRMNAEGEIKGCVVAGPISLDLALDPEAAKIKGYHGNPVAGDADVLVVPNIHTGNALGKSILVLGGGLMAGFVMGARVPIIVTSRGASSEEKYLSLVLAAASSKA
ncbi:MAG: bifunctional enoyl-CoA hydratase/phosphate acetyltransferase [Synergistaceae bacterium]|jgi:phosphate butyryltransferase|nr:bifunctional enoyl-CoA hydratase/phosphate acetyltransferase [Synergistaceae bacterium]